MPASREPAGANHPARWLVLAALAVALTVALLAVADEWRVRRAAADLAESGGEDIPPPGDTVADANTDPPRAALFRALAQARAAERATDPALRTARIQAARGWLARAGAGRPRWGEAALIRAYVEMLDHGPAAARTRAAFDASYADAPYLRDGASWRVHYALGQWAALDPRARAAVANEAAWYSYLSGDGYWEMMQLLVDTPAELPFMRARAEIAARALHDRNAPPPG